MKYDNPVWKTAVIGLEFTVISWLTLGTYITVDLITKEQSLAYLIPWAILTILPCALMWKIKNRLKKKVISATHTNE